MDSRGQYVSRALSVYWIYILVLHAPAQYYTRVKRVQSIAVVRPIQLLADPRTFATSTEVCHMSVRHVSGMLSVWGWDSSASSLQRNAALPAGRDHELRLVAVQKAAC